MRLRSHTKLLEAQRKEQHSSDTYEFNKSEEEQQKNLDQKLDKEIDEHDKREEQQQSSDAYEFDKPEEEQQTNIEDQKLDKEEDEHDKREEQQSSDAYEFDKPEEEQQTNLEDQKLDEEEDEHKDEDLTKDEIMKPLTPQKLAEFEKAQNKTGLVYLSRIPPFMKPAKIKHLLSQFGEIGRVYLAPE
ncbi:10155_t:CDS:2, partial [Scutellospora calospora]